MLTPGPIAITYSVVTVSLITIGLAATGMTWAGSGRVSGLVLTRALVAGFVGVALFVPFEYQDYGLRSAAAFLVGPGLMMWTSIEHHRVAAGQPAWLLPLLQRLVGWGLLRNHGRRFDRILKPEAGPFLTLDQIRDEYARQVLADAHADPNLDEYLVRLSEDALALVRDLETDVEQGAEPEDQSARLLRRRTLLLHLANRWIAIATEPVANARAPGVPGLLDDDLVPGRGVPPGGQQAPAGQLTRGRIAAPR